MNNSEDEDDGIREENIFGDDPNSDDQIINK